MRLRRTVAPVLAAALLLSPPSARADQGGQARQCIVADLPRTHVSPAFLAAMSYRTLDTPHGRVLLAEGGIEQNESVRLEQALARAGAVDEIWLSSPGGSALEGPRMGRVIRQRGLAVRLPSNKACISACTYAFLGGVVRIVEPGGHYGVHMFSSQNDVQFMIQQLDAFASLAAQRNAALRGGGNRAAVDRKVADQVQEYLRSIEQRSARLAADQARYLVEMSLSLDFMTDIFGTRAADICYLTPAGLARYNVVNSR